MNDLKKEVDKIYDQYIQFLKGNVDDILDEVGEKGKKELKAKSPRRTGHYASGWSMEKTNYRGETGRVISNTKYPGLTHLLERGHLTRDGSRVCAQKHIKPVEEMIIDEIVDRIKKL